MCLLYKHFIDDRTLNEAVTCKKQPGMPNNQYETVVKIVLSTVNSQYIFSV